MLNDHTIPSDVSDIKSTGIVCPYCEEYHHLVTWQGFSKDKWGEEGACPIRVGLQMWRRGFLRGYYVSDNITLQLIDKSNEEDIKVFK